MRLSGDCTGDVPSKLSTLVEAFFFFRLNTIQSMHPGSALKSFLYVILRPSLVTSTFSSPVPSSALLELLLDVRGFSDSSSLPHLYPCDRRCSLYNFSRRLSLALSQRICSFFNRFDLTMIYSYVVKFCVCKYICSSTSCRSRQKSGTLIIKSKTQTNGCQ